jgi:hypothetical protein
VEIRGVEVVINLDEGRSEQMSENLENEPKASLQLARQDEFDSVMAWLGKMVSACNYMERTFQEFLVNLLQCQNIESAKIVSRERRSFSAMVDLTRELFEVYVRDQHSLDELKAVAQLAKELYEKRNTHVHSLWYLPLGQTGTAAAERHKNKKNAEPVGVEATELATLASNFDDCSQKLLDLMDQYLTNR